MRCVDPADISKGLQLEDPPAFVRWGIREHELSAALEGNNLRRVTDGYHTMPCRVLDGLTIMIGFHFAPRSAGRLAYFELFRAQYDDLQASFDEFQAHLEQTFGKPSVKEASPSGFSAFRWEFGDVAVFHYVFDRFGPEEHVEIRKR